MDRRPASDAPTMRQAWLPEELDGPKGASLNAKAVQSGRGAITGTALVVCHICTPPQEMELLTGSVSESLASRSKFGRKVAEKRRVCLSGRTCPSRDRICVKEG